MTKRLLYVDDNNDELVIFEAACRMSGVSFQLLTAEGSAAGLAWLEGAGDYADRARFPLPDLVLLDVKMIGADGFDVLARIRGNPALSGVRVVLFTSSVLPDDMRRALALGADACLSKPVELRRTMELARVLEACLEQDGPWGPRLAHFVGP
ncbi:MAG: response regulator [Myxococcota bacterium]